MGTSRREKVTRCILLVMGIFAESEATGSGRVYLDWNATAPVRQVALDAWLDVMRHGWANANSLHAEGKLAAARLADARERIAASTLTRAGEWIFTSGATESIHAALYGAARARRGLRRIVSSQGEHACVRAILADLESQGCEVVRVGLSATGQWDPSEVLEACDPTSTALCTLIWANNETGAVSDVLTVAHELKARRIPLHLDAVQIPGRLPFSLSELPVNLVSISGHKFGAPKGIGALYARRAAAWTPWMLGGEQERGRRAGTSNVAGAIAMTAALEEAARSDFAGMTRLRDGFENAVQARVPGVCVLGVKGARLPNTTALCVDGVESSPLLLRLDDLGFAVSSGSACTSGRTDPSPVLLAMGLTVAQAHTTIRISMGETTTQDDLARLVAVLAEVVPDLRG